MKRCIRIILIILLAFSMPYTYGGCVVVYSSGDIDHEEEKTVDETTGGFIGVASQAAITPMNAEALTLGALAGAPTSVAPKSVKLNHRPKDAQIDVFRPLRLPLVLKNSLDHIKINPAVLIFNRKDVTTQSDNSAGTCGGDFLYSLNLNRITQKFSGSIVFNDYCDDGVIISGAAEVAGTFKIRTGNFETATFSFEDLSVDATTIDGEMSIDFSDSPIFATFTADSKNEPNGPIYRMKDYSINLFQYAGHVAIEIFGTFYHPQEGFVTLTTSEPFVVFDEDDWPSSGQLAIRGDSDTAAQLIAIDQRHYRIEADTEGDKIFDKDLGILNWPDWEIRGTRF